MKLYRMMRVAADGLPAVGDTYAKLGVRPIRPGSQHDVPAALPDDPVRPGDGGMSVFAGPVQNLPARLLPPKAAFPLWEIDEEDLGSGLVLIDAGSPHYVVETKTAIILAQFQVLLAGTRTKWLRV